MLLEMVEAMDGKTLQESEVLEVARVLESNMALSPDGFFLAFFEVHWDVVKEDVMKVFHAFHLKGSLENSLNSTFIALIPKKPRAMQTKDF